MNRKINIFLDDFRQPKEITYINWYQNYYSNTNFIIVKDFLSFKDLIEDCIESNIIIESISFDHDLELPHYSMKNYDDIIDESIYTGYHACKFLLEKLDKSQLKDISFFIHSMSDRGLKNILNLLQEKGFRDNIKGITPLKYRCKR